MTSARNRLLGTTITIGLSLSTLGEIVNGEIEPLSQVLTQAIAQSDAQPSSSSSEESDSAQVPIEVEQFQEIFKLSSMVEQRIALYTTLSSATEQELKVWWNESKKIERASQRKIAQQAILKKLSESNPQEALRLVEAVSELQVDPLLKAVFSQWSVSQLEDAIQAAAELSRRQRKIALQAILYTRDDLSESRLISIARELDGEEYFHMLVSEAKATQAIDKPNEAWEALINDRVDDSLQIEYLTIIARAWYEQIGFESLSRILNAKIEDSQIKLQLLRSVAQEDIAGALDFASEIPQEYDKQVLSALVARAWASMDAPAALTAVSNFEPASWVSALKGSIADSWALTKPLEVIENIELISVGFRLETLETAFSKLASEDPLKAIAEVSSVESYIGNTSSIIRSIVRRWAGQEPEAATDWVLTNVDLEDSHRQKMLEYALEKLALQNPDRAFDLALEHSTDTSGYGLEYRVVSALAQAGEIEEAKSLLPRSPDESRDAVYAVVGSAMVKHKQTDDALELGREMPESEQWLYYDRVLMEWSESYPTDLFERLKELPSETIQSRAAFRLIIDNVSDPVLTDDQIEDAKAYLNTKDKANLKVLEED